MSSWSRMPFFWLSFVSPYKTLIPAPFDTVQFSDSQSFLGAVGIVWIRYNQQQTVMLGNSATKWV